MRPQSKYGAAAVNVTGRARPLPAPVPRPTRSAARRATPGGELSGWLDHVVHFLLPSPCLGCGTPLGARPPALSLCLACRGALARPRRPACAVCAVPLAAAAPPAGFRCGRCHAEPPAFERLVAPWRYAPPLDRAIHAFKFGRREEIGGGLAADIADALAEVSAAAGDAAPEVVVPVPLHWRRRLARGYDQAERIARPLARRLGLPCESVLRRCRATRRQTSLGGVERRRNPRGAFAPARRTPRRGRNLRPERGGTSSRPLAGRRVLLVDDVATTGATLDAAAHALRRQGAAAVIAAAAALAPPAPPPVPPPAAPPETKPLRSRRRIFW